VAVKVAIYVHVVVSFRPGAAIDRDFKHVGGRRSHYVRPVSEAEDEVLGEAGGDVQGRTAPTGKTAIPVSVHVAVQ